MENSSFQIISYISNETGTEKTSLIYDRLNKRVIEKWKSFQLKKDASKFIITDRYVFAYNKHGLLYKTIEIKKGFDDRIYSYLNDNNEYCHCLNRFVTYDSREYTNDYQKTMITYARNNNLGSTRKKHFIKSLQLESEKDWDTGRINTRLKYLIQSGNKLKKYVYCKENFHELLYTLECKIILDLRVINRLFDFIGIPLLMNTPDIFIKKIKTKMKTNSPKPVHKRHINGQDYVRSFSTDYVNINDLIFCEDLFIQEQKNLIKEFNDESQNIH